MDDADAQKPWQGTTHRDEAEVEFSRIVAFSDGVFAIAITLLVLAVEVPRDAADLGEALLDRQDEFVAYAISFAVLGKLWLAHHRFFSAVARFDGVLMGLNLLYLAWVALVPFSSEILGDYSDVSTGVIVYAINMAAVILTFLAQIVYSYRRDLMRPEARKEETRYAGPANLIPAAVFLASIPVALLSTDVAFLMWLLIFVLGRRAADLVAGWMTRRA